MPSQTLLVLVLGIAIVGCGKQPVSKVATTGAAQPALNAWQQGDRVSAISNFVAANWSTRPLFQPGTILSLTEAEFTGQAQPARIVGFVSTGNIEALQKQMMNELGPLKKLASAVAQAGRDAAASNDIALARKHFESLQQFGIALDTTNSLKILRLDGQAIKRKAEAELAQLTQ
jgi:hypothetical protein